MNKYHRHVFDTTSRALTADDAGALQQLRLKALKEDGCFFTANYQEEASRTHNQWRDAAQETTEKAYFGAFINGQLVGMVGAKKWDKDPSGKTAYWRSDYTLPEYRKSAVVARLYKLRVDWCNEHGFDQAVFTINHQNNVSAAIHTKRGAEAFGVEPLEFADGQTHMAYWYKKDLKCNLG